MSASDMGSLYLTDSAGVVLYDIPNPVMWDSSGVAGQSEPALVNAPFTFVQNAAGDWLITVTPNRAWLTDPSRVYPVLIDPTIHEGPSTEESYESNGTTYAGEGRMGNSRVGSENTYWRTLACFPYSALVQADEITTSSHLAYDYVAGTANTEPGYVYNATGSGYGDLGTQLATWSITTGGGDTSGAGLGNEYQYWDNEDAKTKCLMLRGYELAGSYTYKDVSAGIYLNYEAAPALTVVAPSPMSGGSASPTPTLAVSATDPSSASQNITFEVSENSNPDTSPLWTDTVAGTTSASGSMPSDTLPPGPTYYWKATVTDEYGAIRSTAVQSFTRTNQAPNQPTSLSASPLFSPFGSQNPNADVATLSAINSDPDGDDVTTRFEVHNSTTISSTSLVVSCSAGTVNSGGTASCDLPQPLPNGTYYVRATSNDGLTDGPWSDWLTLPISMPTAAAPTGSQFQPASGRLLDTLDGTGGYPIAPLSPGWQSVAVDGVAGIPASGVTAVEVNLTVVGPEAGGSIEADADGASTPNTSTDYLTYSGTTSGASYSNMAIIPVGADGAIQINATSSVDMIIDLEGYYTSNATADAYYPLQATNIANTVDGTGGVAQAQVANGGVITAQVAGVAGVPANAGAVVISVSESNATTGNGVLMVYPQGASSHGPGLDWANGEAGAWTSTVTLLSSGRVSVQVVNGGPVDVAIAVEGYFIGASTSSTGAFTPIGARVFDSAAASESLSGQSSDTLSIAGVGSVPSVGAGITAVALNISVTAGAASSGQLQVYGDDASAGPSEINFDASGSPSGLVIVPLGADGGITIQNQSSGTIDYVVDIEGWYSGIGAPIISCPSGIADGSWNLVPPSAAFNCTVVGPPALSGQGTMSVSVDGGASTDLTLSATGSTTSLVPFAAGAGAHNIQVLVSGAATGPGAASTYAFGSGLWPNADLVPNIANGANSDDLSPSLWVGTDGAPFSDGTTIRYTLAANPDGTNPILVS
ncbi:MAG TPA: hypothetical protein VHX87_03195, partial [Galbitalea sp.]|nr:hypothetical protein [Galbitalea sp.]